MVRRTPGGKLSGKNIFPNEKQNAFGLQILQIEFFDRVDVLFSFLTENDTERFRIYLKKSVWAIERALLNRLI